MEDSIIHASALVLMLTGPFYIILNTAMDWWNAKSGTPKSVYPVEHIIDYVKLYKKE